ncbi:MAG: hypothetical protein IPO22_09805 [Anaerolineales bacterium]|nr:hypothetical protein [Anaerolineales bacterium]
MMKSVPLVVGKESMFAQPVVASEHFLRVMDQKRVGNLAQDVQAVGQLPAPSVMAVEKRKR